MDTEPGRSSAWSRVGADAVPPAPLLQAAALESLPLEAAVVAADGTIVSGNERWRAFARENGSRDRDASIGQNYFAASERGVRDGAPGAQDAKDLLMDALEGRRHDREVVYPCGRPERMRWFSMRASGYRTADGAQLAVVTHEDVTARVEAQRHAQERAADLDGVAQGLRSRNQDLESFGHMVSHDLRAPLRALDLLCDIVVETLPEPSPEPTVRAVAGIRREVGRISSLVEGLLSLSRVAQRDLRREEVDLSAIARDVVANLRRDHPRRDVTVDVQDGLVVDADPTLARLLLENLLSNAWKYTATREDARIEMGRSMTRERGDAFYVRDNGIGFALPGPAAAALFEPFRRTPEAAGFEGTGIGLATVARIVERHRGHAWAQGKPGGGATFWFTLGPGEADARATPAD